MNEATAQEAANRANQAVQKLLQLATQAERGKGVFALERLKERRQDKEYNEAERLLEELRASVVLVGGSEISNDDLANMPLGELLAMALPNKINFRIWPSQEQFRANH